MSGPELAPDASDAGADAGERDGGERWRSPQPNVTGLGLVASYTVKFWAIVVILGAVTGLGGAALIGLLRLVERLTYGARGPTLLSIVRQSSTWRHVAALMLAAVIVIVGLRVLGRLPTGGSEVSEAIWLRSGRLGWLHEHRPRRAVDRDRRDGRVARARGGAAAVGRGHGEPPRRVGGAADVAATAAGRLRRRRGLRGRLQRPAGGHAARARGDARHARAAARAAGAADVGDLDRGCVDLPRASRPLYHVAHYAFRPSQLVYALLFGPIFGLVAVDWTRLIAAANRAGRSGVGRWVAPFAAFGLLGLLSLQYPQLLGNGRGIVQTTIVANLSLGLLLILFVLKPLVTAACVASGAPGGLFTPTFAVGVLLAGAIGAIWSHVWPGAASGSYALIGGGAFLAAAMQGPLDGRRARARADGQHRRADGADAGRDRRGDDRRPPARCRFDLLRPPGPIPWGPDRQRRRGCGDPGARRSAATG